MPSFVREERNVLLERSRAFLPIEVKRGYSSDISPQDRAIFPTRRRLSESAAALIFRTKNIKAQSDQSTRISACFTCAQVRISRPWPWASLASRARFQDRCHRLSIPGLRLSRNLKVTRSVSHHIQLKRVKYCTVDRPRLRRRKKEKEREITAQNK